MEEDDPFVAVQIRIRRSVWRAANEQAVLDEVPVCELMEKGIRKEVHARVMEALSKSLPKDS